MTVCNLFACVLPLPRQEEAMKIAGIDVHKKVLMVVVMDASRPEEKPQRRRFAAMPSELHRLLIWLQQEGVEEAVMESTNKCTRGRRCGPMFSRNPSISSAVWTVAGASRPRSGVERRACVLSRPQW